MAVQALGGRHVPEQRPSAAHSDPIAEQLLGTQQPLKAAGVCAGWGARVSAPSPVHGPKFCPRPRGLGRPPTWLPVRPRALTVVTAQGRPLPGVAPGCACTWLGVAHTHEPRARSSSSMPSPPWDPGELRGDREGWGWPWRLGDPHPQESSPLGFLQVAGWGAGPQPGV